MMLSNFGITRTLRVALIAAVSGVLALDVQSARSQDKGTVVVSSYGGKYTDALREAVLKPFEQATGIKVVEVTGMTLPKIRAMVMAKNVEVDVLELVSTEMNTLTRQDSLEKIDYKALDQATIEQLYKGSVQPYGVGFLYYSQGIAYNTKSYSKENHPRNWAEFWDTKKYPGRRFFPIGDYAWSSPIEAALIADGVPPDQLYPLDLERAYKSLSRLKPAVTKWTNSASANPQGLVDGEADLGFANSSRIEELKQQGAPVDFEWNQAFLSQDFLCIPNGAKNLKNALVYISFALSAASEARIAKLMPYGPGNKAAIELLPKDVLDTLSSGPENLARQVPLNADWWMQVDASGKTNVERNAAMWNSWSK
jgi:putative spermidine/putrescine transport system substrate-binding protein